MKIYWTNQTTYYRNPTINDFISCRVDVRIDSIETYTTWQEWQETNGTLNFRVGTEIAHLDLSSDIPPAQLKVISNDGNVHYFYKSKFVKWFNEDDSNKSWFRYEYVLNKWDSKHLPLFNKMIQSRTQIKFVQKQADEVIFHYNLDFLDETRDLIVTDDSDESIKEAISYVFNFNPDYINKYYSLQINRENQTISIIPLEKDDGTYYFTNGNPLIAGQFITPWHYVIGNVNDNVIQTNPIFYCINIHIQKHLGDTKRRFDDPVRYLIGGKTAEDLYQMNGISSDTTITFYHFSNHSMTKQFTCKQLDSMFRTFLGNYEHIACKSGTLKMWSGDHKTITSLGDQTILKIPLNNDYLKLMNKIRDIIYPPYDEGGAPLGPTPQPWLVQIDPISTQNKYSDAVLDDTPIGLLFILGRQTINQKRAKLGMKQLTDEDIFQFANIGYEDDGWHDDGSVVFLRTDINHDITLQISSLDDKYSLESDAKRIIKNKINQQDDFDINAILLNPAYQYEGIFYDNDSFLLIDFSKISYNIQANEIDNGGLTLYCHLCWIHSLIYFYDFGDLNNDLDKEWNNNKTNLRFENKKTVGIMGDNANNMMNGSALASYTNYKTNVNTWQNREQHFAISEAMKSMGLIGDIVGMFNPLNWFSKKGKALSSGERAGNAFGGAEDIAGDVAGMATSALDFQYQNNQQKLKYNNQIQNVRSQTNIEVSIPYISAFGSQKENELFKRYKFTLKKWDKIKLLTEVRANGYVYDSLGTFDMYDNRQTHNFVRISSDWNMNVIRNELISNQLYQDEMNVNEFLDWLVSGIRIWKKEITDITTTSNLENILIPPATQKRNINTILNFTNFLGYHFNDDRLEDQNEWKNDIQKIADEISRGKIWPIDFWENVHFDFSNVYNGIVKVIANLDSEKYFGTKTFTFMIVNINTIDQLAYQKYVGGASSLNNLIPTKYRTTEYKAFIELALPLTDEGYGNYAVQTVVLSSLEPDENGYLYGGGNQAVIYTNHNSHITWVYIKTSNDDKSQKWKYEDNNINFIGQTSSWTGISGDVTITRVSIYKNASETI